VILSALDPADTDFARAALTWVRDRVAHSLDVQDPRITFSAVEVLVRPDAGVVAALRASADALALCRSALPSTLGEVS
jgi:hypothetical protein